MNRDAALILLLGGAAVALLYSTSSQAAPVSQGWTEPPPPDSSSWLPDLTSWAGGSTGNDQQTQPAGQIQAGAASPGSDVSPGWAGTGWDGPAAGPAVADLAEGYGIATAGPAISPSAAVAAGEGNIVNDAPQAGFLDRLFGGSSMSKFTDWMANPSNAARAAPYQPWIAEQESRYGIPDGLLLRLIWQESRFNPNASNPSGARGIAQLMPGTAIELGLQVDSSTDERLDPDTSIEAAASYLEGLYNDFGDWLVALAAYNWGPGNMKKFLARQPIKTSSGAMVVFSAPPAETRNYVAMIGESSPWG